MEMPCGADGCASGQGIPSTSLGAGSSTAFVLRFREAQTSLRMTGPGT